MAPKRQRISGGYGEHLGAQAGPSRQPPNDMGGTSTPRRNRSNSKSSQASPEHPNPSRWAYPAAGPPGPRGAIGPPPQHRHAGPLGNSRYPNGGYRGGGYPLGHDGYNGPPPGAEEPEEPPATEEEPSARICVFQCKQCLRLLGDTFSWLHADYKLGYIVLAATTEDVREKDGLRHIITQTPDMGSSYLSLECAGCQADVGKKYVTTPQELDHLRGAYSLVIEQFQTYQLGSSASVSAATTSSAAHSVAATTEDSATTKKFVRALADRLVQLEEDQRGINALLRAVIEKTGVHLSDDDDEDNGDEDEQGSMAIAT